MKQALTTVIALAAFCVPAFAATIDVEMLNQNADGEKMVFSQELIEVEVGDTIRFIPTDKSHNAQSVKGALPEGQEGFRGRMNQEVIYEVTEPGLTAIVCLPHQSMGMVALVVAGGSTENADDVLKARIPGKGGKKIEALVEQALEAQSS